MVITTAEGLPDPSSRRSISKRSSLAVLGRFKMKSVSLFLASSSSLYCFTTFATSGGGSHLPTKVPSFMCRIFAMSNPAGLRAEESASQRPCMSPEKVAGRSFNASFSKFMILSSIA